MIKTLTPNPNPARPKPYRARPHPKSARLQYNISFSAFQASNALVKTGNYAAKNYFVDYLLKKTTQFGLNVGFQLKY